jgi:thioredoxin-like negative regulator of GroEL
MVMLRSIIACVFIRKLCFALFLGATLLSALPANAYATDTRAFMQAFRHSYKNPADVNAALAYAQEAVKIGNYEAAIPPLERILMFNPKLTEVRLEVGVLYYLLNSKDMARKHLSQVANDSATTDTNKARAASYLAKL